LAASRYMINLVLSVCWSVVSFKVVDNFFGEIFQVGIPLDKE